MWPFSSWFVIGSGIENINKAIAKDYINNINDTQGDKKNGRVKIQGGKYALN